MTDDARAALTADSEADLVLFIAGLDSPNHSPESRRAWCHLVLKDARSGYIRLGPADAVLVTPKALASAIEDHFATGRHGWSYTSCATAIVMAFAPAPSDEPG